MSFQQGLSGLNSSSKSLDVIGNNVANASVVGFKPFRAEFSDAFAASLNTGGTNNIGIGSSLAAVTQQFLQGEITSTSNPLDVAVNGDGFFRMSDNGAISYTRNGQFQVDKSGYIVNSAGHHLTGYDADSSGNIISSSPVDLQIDSTDLQPQATSTQTVGVNLDSRLSAITATFDSTDATTYNKSASQTVYDSLGNPHTQALYFQKTASNSWNVYMTVDGTAVNLNGASAAATMTFGTDGTLSTVTSSGATTDHILSASYTAAGANAQTFDIDVSNFTQFGSSYSVNTQTQDGYSSGRLSGITIADDGTVQGNYTNGQSRNMGQIVLANFTNPQGLQAKGSNEWIETPDSGGEIIGTPGSSSLGVLQSSAIEESKVDLTEELVNMITAQRIYQANAQTIKTQDQVLQTLVNLR